MRLVANTDGGAKGNPGPAGIGVVIARQPGDVVYSIGKRIGWATNNEAEYAALLHCLNAIICEKKIRSGNEKELVIQSDSALIIEQMSGRWKVKNPRIRVLHREANLLCDTIRSLGMKICYVHVPREQNHHADALYNAAMDGSKRYDRTPSEASMEAGIKTISRRYVPAKFGYRMKVKRD